VRWVVLRDCLSLVSNCVQSVADGDGDHVSVMSDVGASGCSVPER
jgi:hypothetical protein